MVGRRVETRHFRCGRFRRSGQDSGPRAVRRRLRELQRYVLLEDRPLQLPQSRARLERKLLDEERPPGTVDSKRIRLPPGTVEREHELRAQPFTQGMLGNEYLEFGAQCGLPTERKLRLDPVLYRRGTQLLEPHDLEPRELLKFEIGKRPAAPQRLPSRNIAAARPGSSC